jgi:serine/threonine-protein kinase
VRIEVPAWALRLPDGASQPVTLPAHVDDALPRGAARFALTTHLELPPEARGRPLTLVLPHMQGRASLAVDGREAVALDPPSPQERRATRPHRWRLPAEATARGAVDLALEVEHRVPRTAWFDGVPWITSEQDGGTAALLVPNLVTAAAWFAIAASVVVALLYGTLFVSMRADRRGAHGWFALGAACGVAYPAFVLGLTQRPFGDAEASVVAVVLAAGSTAAMFFSRAYAGAPAPPRAWWLLVAGAAAAALFAGWTLDPLAVVFPVVLVACAANAVAQVRFLAQLRRTRRELPLASTAVALAWPTAALVSLPDIAALVGWGEPAGGFRVGCVAIAGLSVHQAVALGREHLSALARADGLVGELAERVRLLQAKHAEVEVLNDELRRQIGARSRELAEKLAREDAGEIAAKSPPPALSCGDVVEGRYRVVKELGSGGMGTVYEVARVADGKHFALKALAGGGAPEQRARFAREAQLVAELDHPNVVAIVDVELAAAGYLFLVMDLVVDGTTLHDVRRRHKDIPWTLGVLAQVADGLAAIHAKDIVHRDLKPANVLLSRGEDGRRPVVKITDFGIATLQPDGASAITVNGRAMLVRAATGSLPPVEEIAPASEGPDERPPTPSTPTPSPNAPLTRTGLIFGTPQYMAQELAYGSKHATRASDVFALGILAFELLTGRRPFSEGPVAARLEGRPLPAAPKLRKVCPTLPAAVAKALDAAMAHDPRARPTATELAHVLHEAVAALPS